MSKTMTIEEADGVIKSLTSMLIAARTERDSLRKKLDLHQAAIREIEGERERLQQMWDERPGMVEHRAAESILDALDLLKTKLA